MQSPFFTLAWQDDSVVMIDQRRLPGEEVYLRYRTYLGVAEAIRSMVVRGAPAIGVAGAMGAALAALSSKASDVKMFRADMEEALEVLAATRPTAVNLFWGLDKIRNILDENQSIGVEDLKQKVRREALRIGEEDLAINRRMGEIGVELIQDGDCVLTHCNAGALATAGHGTALGILYSAWQSGKRFSVYADETRPFLQGARLTAWELQKAGIPTTLICDNMAGAFMAQGKIHKVVVGADRIARNGDVANKIGTYSVAVLAHYHRIPLYVVAPTSTIDPKTPSGGEIPIEERSAEEVAQLAGARVAPAGIAIRNPAFDVTPSELVAAIVTEKGIFRSPYDFGAL